MATTVAIVFLLIVTIQREHSKGSTRVETILQIISDPGPLNEWERGRHGYVEEHDALEDTELLRTRWLFQEAIKQLDVAELSILSKQEKPAAWLRDSISIESDGLSGRIRLQLQGWPPEETTAILDAIAQAFIVTVQEMSRGTAEKIASLRQHRHRLNSQSDVGSEQAKEIDCQIEYLSAKILLIGEVQVLRHSEVVRE